MPGAPQPLNVDAIVLSSGWNRIVNALAPISAHPEAFHLSPKGPMSRQQGQTLAETRW